MHTDIRFPWLEKATVAPGPTVDELARLRELAQYDADTDDSGLCHTCYGRGEVDQNCASFGYTIQCPDCDAGDHL